MLRMLARYAKRSYLDNVVTLQLVHVHKSHAQRAAAVGKVTLCGAPTRGGGRLTGTARGRAWFMCGMDEEGQCLHCPPVPWRLLGRGGLLVIGHGLRLMVF